MSCSCRSREDRLYGKFFRDWKNTSDEAFKDNIWLLVPATLSMQGMQRVFHLTFYVSVLWKLPNLCRTGAYPFHINGLS